MGWGEKGGRCDRRGGARPPPPTASPPTPPPPLSHQELVDVHGRVDGDFPPEIIFKRLILAARGRAVAQQLGQALVVAGGGRAWVGGPRQRAMGAMGGHRGRSRPRGGGRECRGGHPTRLDAPGGGRGRGGGESGVGEADGAAATLRALAPKTVHTRLPAPLSISIVLLPQRHECLRLPLARRALPLGGLPLLPVARGPAFPGQRGAARQRVLDARRGREF